MSLLKLTDKGLYCQAGDFYVDPWRPVDRALITHAHSDHARYGSKCYLSLPATGQILKIRLGQDINLETVDYQETRDINGVKVSFHPAGHILGSAQVKVEYKGEVFVVSGDYKLDPDSTCLNFEPVKCHTFITESTFGLPVYQWPDQDLVFSEINDWWQSNQKDKKASIIFAYALGKAQRVLMGVDPSIGPIYTHGSVENLNKIYRNCNVKLPDTTYVNEVEGKPDWSKALIVAPPSAQQSTWLKKFGPKSTGFASGWMRIRGARRRRSVDRGFVLSDHADWPGLTKAIQSSQAQNVLVTHGYTAPMVRWLNDRGINSMSLSTQFTGEQDDDAMEVEDSTTESGN